MNKKKILPLILTLIAIHSILVGIGLIIMPSKIMEFLGFSICTERFFPTQGGVFHIIMAIAYLMAATGRSKYDTLISFSILVKFCATLFLLTYFFFVSQTWMILFSGISDFLMGIAIWWTYKYSRKIELSATP